MIDFDKLSENAKKKSNENKRFLEKLRKKKPKGLDDIVAGLHEEVFGYIDCLECANCCKSISPIIIDRDIDRMAKHLKISPSLFTEQYLEIDSEGDYVFRQVPCPFLMPDNYCSIYDVRPRACREYPHTDRKRFYQITELTLKNTFICPAVFDIMEKLKPVLK